MTDDRTVTAQAKPRRRCLFCGTTAGKRSREHVFRRAFKGTHHEAPSLTFSAQTKEDLTIYTRPISQFDMTLNRVCQQCNSGWLNDLENCVAPTLQKITHLPVGPIDFDELKNLGFWAYVRALIRTHISPRGHAPDSMFEDAYNNRCVPRGSYVQLGWCTHYIFEAGAHQSVRLDDHYVAHVAFGLGPSLFLVSMTEGDEMLSRTLDVSRRPRLWFPGALHWLSPTEHFDSPRVPRIMTAEEAMATGLSLPIRMGVDPLVDNFGNMIDLTIPIPERFHTTLKWTDIVDGPIGEQ